MISLNKYQGAVSVLWMLFEKKQNQEATVYCLLFVKCLFDVNPLKHQGQPCSTWMFLQYMT